MTQPTHDRTATTEQPRRMSMGRVVEMLLQRGSSQSSSVTLTRNAKGETQIEVVVRTDHELGLVTVDDASTAAERVYDALRTKYPHGDDPGTNGGAA